MLIYFVDSLNTELPNLKSKFKKLSSESTFTTFNPDRLGDLYHKHIESHRKELG